MEPHEMTVVFGMVSTRHSLEFTRLAVDSFLRTTSLENGSQFLLLDNDQSAGEMPPAVTVLRNNSPRSFAANMNVVLRRAVRERADAVLLNNDLVFTTDWYPPVAAIPGAIVSPVSNAEAHYTHGLLDCLPTMELAQYRGNEEALEGVAAYNRAHPQQFGAIPAVPFFCVRIPLEVIETVGFLDEGYIMGAEDKDYCVRALQAGVHIRIAATSFVLHFQGRSTWRGPETPQETYLRNERYAQHFVEKWGPTLTRLFILQDARVLEATPELRAAWEEGRFGFVIRELVRRRGGE
jgi:GT2 family glycosyltransferase